MNRATLESIKTAIAKGTALEEFELLPKPANRIGYKWVPLVDNVGKSIGWTEVVDPDYVPTNSGTYIDPIPYTVGMTVTAGLWYTDNSDIWEAIASGVPSGFDDTTYFDIVG